MANAKGLSALAERARTFAPKAETAVVLGGAVSSFAESSIGESSFRRDAFPASGSSWRFSSVGEILRSVAGRFGPRVLVLR